MGQDHIPGRMPPRSARVVEAWVRRDGPGEHAQRQEADAQVFAQLKSEKFTGPNWDLFANEVARYGLAVIRGWLRDGRILEKCREKGIRAPLLPAHATADHHTLMSLADDIVTLALVKYRDEVLMADRWDPARGASLRTFFIGQCLFQYANVARAWIREQNKPQALLVGHDEYELLTSGRIDPATEDVIRDVASAALRAGAANHRAAMVLALESVGYSRAEIAAELDISTGAAASILKRERARLKQTMTDTRREDTA